MPSDSRIVAAIGHFDFKAGSIPRSHRPIRPILSFPMFPPSDRDLSKARVAKTDAFLGDARLHTSQVDGILNRCINCINLTYLDL